MSMTNPKVLGAGCQCGEFVKADLVTLADHFCARHNVCRVDALIMARKMLRAFKRQAKDPRK